ncbi:MAG TPA: hypothetical protein VHA80_05495 [Solirubrobacterales bacterium]|nr:hypothetical protein [Solirubrobacterales bacterium]
MSDLEGGRGERGAPTVERSLDRKYLVRRVATEDGTRAERFLDDRDRAIVDERMALLDARTGPRVGDFVVFADGTERRISYAWPAGDRWPASMQTSDGGRFYLGPSGASFSGSLHPGVSEETLTDTGETREGDAWIFHHDAHRAHNGVEFKAPFRVYRCSLPVDSAERRSPG